MKLSYIASALSLIIITGSACRKEDQAVSPQRAVKAGVVIAAIPTDTLRGIITADRTLESDREWILDGLVYVKSGVTLTIRPGTLIKGLAKPQGSLNNPGGGLIVTPGAKLIANGTPFAPIVFTSTNVSASRQPGDWAGVMILGKAGSSLTGITSSYKLNTAYVPQQNAKSNATDTSGELSYIRMEFAGYNFAQNVSFNGLSLIGVGSGTSVHHIQVSYANGDAFLLAGGSVNAANLVALAPKENGLSFSLGYHGKIQYALTVADPSFTRSSGNGIESNSSVLGIPLQPVTRPVISNATLIGTATATSSTAIGSLWKANTSFVFSNSVVMGYSKGVVLDNQQGKTQEKFQNGNAVLKHNLVEAFSAPFATVAGSLSTAAFTTLATNATNKNTGYTVVNGNDSLRLFLPFELLFPFPLPDVTSPAIEGAVFDGDLADAFFEKTATFRGAFGAENWLEGWTYFDPKNVDY